MGKIAGYPTDNDVQLSDKLIGSDVADQFGAKNLQTKNYTVGDILGVSGSPTYVPYTGALGSVNLGVHGMTLTAITVNGAFTDSVASAGTLNQILSVAASGFVEWKDPVAVSGAVPYVGADQDVDLGGQSLSLVNIDIAGTITDRNDSIGTNGQVLVSANTSGTQWTSDLTFLNEVVTSDFTATGVFNDSTPTPATAGDVFTGSIGGSALWFRPTLVGETRTTASSIVLPDTTSGQVPSAILFGASFNGDGVSYAAGVITFTKAGTYAIRYKCNIVGQSGSNAQVSVYEVSGTNDVEGGDALYSSPSIIGLSDVIPYNLDRTSIVCVSANDKWRLTMGLNENIQAALSQVPLLAYNGEKNCEAAALQVFKLS
jgi:hypothetical protein